MESARLLKSSSIRSIRPRWDERAGSKIVAHPGAWRDMKSVGHRSSRGANAEAILRSIARHTRPMRADLASRERVASEAIAATESAYAPSSTRSSLTMASWSATNPACSRETTSD